MNSEIKLQCHGFTLSSIIHEFLNASTDTEGLILGSCTTNSFQKFTDESSNQTWKEEEFIRIESILPTGGTFSFYDWNGNLDKEKLQKHLDFVEKQNKMVVGWFRYRRGTKLQETLREATVHTQLCKFFSPTVMETNFVLGLFTGSHVEKALVNMNYRFLVSPRSKTQQVMGIPSMVAVPITIHNLMETSHKEYKEFALLCSPNVQLSSQQTTAISGVHSNSEKMVNQLEKFFKSSLSDLQSLVKNVEESKKKLQKKMQRIEELRKALESDVDVEITT